MLISVKLLFSTYTNARLELMAPHGFHSLKNLYRYFCHNMDQNGSPRSPQIFIFSFWWHKYYFQNSFIRLVAVKLQFTKHEVVILEIMVPCIFWFFKKYPYRYFCHDIYQNCIPRNHFTKHLFCLLMVLNIIFRYFCSCYLQ